MVRKFRPSHWVRRGAGCVSVVMFGVATVGLVAGPAAGPAAAQAPAAPAAPAATTPPAGPSDQAKAAAAKIAASAAVPADELYEKAVAAGLDYLRVRGQAPDGSFSAAAGPGVTALVATSMLRQGRTADDPVVKRAIDYVLKFAQPDGGIHTPESLYGNYETCLALMCLQEANRDGRYNEAIAAGRKYLADIQWDESEGKNQADYAFGGAGYGSHKRPDLSNTNFLIETLRSTGSNADDEAIQRALVFVSRCQNLESPHNTTPFATKNPDGGFYYSAAAGGSSQAGNTETGGLRSYGSMTYAGLKSMIYAGVNRDDQRVKAALQWLQDHYTLETNPSMGDSGLYYYYHTMAKALATLGDDQFHDTSGQVHNWREELIRTLAARQQENGSWINATPRWMEGDPNLTTGYALLALSYCRPGAPAADTQQGTQR